MKNHQYMFETTNSVRELCELSCEDCEYNDDGSLYCRCCSCDKDEQYYIESVIDCGNSNGAVLFSFLSLNKRYLVDDLTFLELLNFAHITIDLMEANFSDGILNLIIEKRQSGHYKCEMVIPQLPKQQ